MHFWLNPDVGCQAPSSSLDQEAATHLWGNCSEEVEQKPVYIWFLARKYMQSSIHVGKRLLLTTKNEYLSSVTQSCPTFCDPMDCSTPGLLVHHQLLAFTQTHVHWVSVMPPSHLILCCPLLLLPSIFPSIRVFSNESVLHCSWPKNWSFSFSISPANEYSGLISFRMDWLDLLAVQGILKSLLQHHSSKASILQCSAFFISS